MFDYQKALKFAENLCREKGNFLLSVWEDIGELEFHDAIDFSTKYDKQIEKEVYDAIKKQYPEHGFFGEEYEQLRDEQSDFVWNVDPIDGTKYFGKQVPMFTTIMGLMYRNEPVLGVVYNPSSKQLYSGAKGIGSFLNGKNLSIKDEGKTLLDSIISLELGDEDKAWESKKVVNVLAKAGRVRIFGNATLIICWSLQGALSGYVDFFGMRDHGKKQDLVAPLAIAKEAGMVTKEISVGKKKKLFCVYPSLVNEIEKIFAE